MLLFKSDIFNAINMNETKEKFFCLIYIYITGGAVMRTKITLACTECKQRNYDSMKNKKNDPDRLEMKKYCKFCKKHTLHRETK